MAQGKCSNDIEKCMDCCKEMFTQILSDVLEGGNQEAHEMEASIFKQLMKLGFFFNATVLCRHK